MTTFENGHEPNPQQKRRQGKRRRFLNAIEKGPLWVFCRALVFPSDFLEEFRFPIYLWRPIRSR